VSQAAPSQSSPAPVPDRPAILIIDDEPAVRNVTRTLLERAGYRVLTASSGEEGLEVYQANTAAIGLVVLDLTMPRMSGKEVLNALTRIGPDVRVIVASGYSHPDGMPSGENVAGFLHKPFRFDELLTLVRRATPGT
jgi:DNA-binding NtrC family response regulator